MVYFVGAGSGAADLITVRGMHMLQQADVIIYAGSLVNPELLQYAKTDCEIHNSAKLTLEEVLQICLLYTSTAFGNPDAADRRRAEEGKGIDHQQIPWRQYNFRSRHSDVNRTGTSAGAGDLSLIHI